MKRQLGLSAILAVGACASGGAPPPSRDQYLGGTSGDLRVLLDDQCPQAYPVVTMPDRGQPEKGLDDEFDVLSSLGLGMLTKVGGIAFQSFGTYLKQAGQESVTRSVGANGGLFYSRPDFNEDVTINPTLRCMYLVRNGYAPQRPNFANDAGDELKQVWTRLGLTRTPDLFAQLHIETSGDIGGGVMLTSGGETEPTADVPAFWNPAVSPPYFRLKLDRLYVRQFQAPVAGDTRDLALVFNYGLAAAHTVVVADGANAGAPELSAKFAVGGIRLAGAQKADYANGSLTALQTAWMPVPGVKNYDPRATVDVVAYVVEFAPGNPMLEEIGEYLAGQEVRQKVENALTQTMGGDN